MRLFEPEELLSDRNRLLRRKDHGRVAARPEEGAECIEGTAVQGENRLAPRGCRASVRRVRSDRIDAGDDSFHIPDICSENPRPQAILLQNQAGSADHLFLEI